MFHRQKIPPVLILAAALMAIAGQAIAGRIDGRPLQVLSGDRLLLVSDDNTRYQVTLRDVSAAAPDSRWGAAAKRHLGMLVLGRRIRVEFDTLPGSSQLRSRVLLGETDINLRMIQAGLVRHTPAERAPWNESYALAERQARAHGLGLWSEGNAARKPVTRRVPGGPLPRQAR